MRMNGRPWTPHEDATLLEMRAAGEKTSVIADKLYRGMAAVKNRERYIKMTPEQHEARAIDKRSVRRERGEVTQFTDVRAEVPPEVWEERNRRLAATHTLTGSFFKDPPVGFSALDRKQRGVLNDR